MATHNDRSIRTSLRGEYCPIAYCVRFCVRGGVHIRETNNLFIKCNKTNKNDCMIFILCGMEMEIAHRRASAFTPHTKSDLNLESIFGACSAGRVSCQNGINFAAHLMRPFAGTSNYPRTNKMRRQMIRMGILNFYSGITRRYERCQSVKLRYSEWNDSLVMSHRDTVCSKSFTVNRVWVQVSGLSFIHFVPIGCKWRPNSSTAKVIERIRRVCVVRGDRLFR